jgi:hypothetical protein
MYRAGPVPPGTGRTGPVPTGFANPDHGGTLVSSTLSGVCRVHVCDLVLEMLTTMFKSVIHANIFLVITDTAFLCMGSTTTGSNHVCAEGRGACVLHAVGKIKVSSSLVLNSYKSSLLETEFVLYGSPDDYQETSQESDRNYENKTGFL